MQRAKESTRKQDGCAVTVVVEVNKSLVSKQQPKKPGRTSNVKKKLCGQDRCQRRGEEEEEVKRFKRDELSNTSTSQCCANLLAEGDSRSKNRLSNL